MPEFPLVNNTCLLANANANQVMVHQCELIYKLLAFLPHI